jgi:hypothetical protein
MLTNMSECIRAYQRAYIAQVFRRDLHELYSALSVELALEIGIEQPPTLDDFDRALEHLTLRDDRRESLDIGISFNQSMLIPIGTDMWLLDLAWVKEILFGLCWGIEVADGNFKGAALEELVAGEVDYLPTYPCKGPDGSKKQIDASFAVDDTLVIVECKARTWSVDFERGKPNAYSHRINRIIIPAINEVDKKAEWLAKRPVGRNYDISGFRRILPIVVTPFTEFIHSRHSKYWLTHDVPRVLNPSELKRILEDGTVSQAVRELSNTVPIAPTGMES